jgi:hypothetical protein
MKKGNQGSSTFKARNSYRIAALDEMANRIGYMLLIGAPGGDDLASEHPCWPDFNTQIMSRIRTANPQPGGKIRAPQGNYND